MKQCNVSSINRLRHKSLRVKTIENEKEKYEAMKESIRNTKSRDKLSENSVNIRENIENAKT